MKVKFLDRSDWDAIFGRRAKLPGAHGLSHRAVDSVPERSQNLQVGDLASRVDGDVQHSP